MKQTFYYLILGCLISIQGYAQWSGGANELLTSGNATIENNVPKIFFNDLPGPVFGGLLNTGLVFQDNGTDELYNFYSLSRNEVYWAKSTGWSDNNGSTNALSVDLDLPDMDPTSRGFVQFGPKDGLHMDFDNNEIQARDDLGTKPLFVNYIGSDITLGDVISHGGLFYDRSEASVGIGTNVPQDELHVMGNVRVQGTAANLKFVDLSGGLQAQIQLTGQDLKTIAEDQLEFYSGGNIGQARMIISDTGRIGIGESNPAYTLDVNGDGNFTGELTAASDLRLKHNIEVIENASHILNQLNPVSYEFKHEAFPNLSLSQGVRLGLIAQEVETVLPELVSDKSKVINQNGEVRQYKSLNYIEMIPLLIKSHQEQSELIRQLNDEIDYLKAKRSE